MKCKLWMPSALYWVATLLALAAVQEPYAGPLLYVSEGTVYVDVISSGGEVAHLPGFDPLGQPELPRGLALSKDGTLYFADGGLAELWKLPTGGYANSWLPTYPHWPSGLVIGNGNFFVASFFGGFGLIDEITPQGEMTTFAQLPRFAEPWGLAFNSIGNLFATDFHSHVYEMTPDGRVSTFGTFSSSSALTGIAFHSLGDLFVSDFEGSIYRIKPDGTESIYANLPAHSGVTGLAFDSKGNLYATEANLDTVVRITPSGEVTDFAHVWAPQFLLLAPQASTVPDNSPTTLYLLFAGLSLFAVSQKWQPRFAN